MSNDNKIVGSVLIVGGGIAGMVSALDLADNGYKVYLIDKTPSIGGTMSQLDKTFPTLDCAMCTMAPRMVDISRHPNIELMPYTVLESVEGSVGCFNVKLRKIESRINENCIGCGDCSAVCPVEVPNEYDENGGIRKAVYSPFPQAVPKLFVIDAEHCIKCYKCVEASVGKNCIDFSIKDKIIDLEVGDIIIAPGFELWNPSLRPELGYGKYPNVLTGIELERLINASGFTSGEILRADTEEVPKKIGFIQCVGSRDVKAGQPYCSRVCCMYAIKQAILVKEHHPEIDCTIFYMDIRAFGKGQEEFYNRAKDEYGIKFIRANPGEVYQDGKDLVVRFEDTTASEVREERFDLVILANAIKSNNKNLSEILGIELDVDGFIKEQNNNPMVTSRPGVYVAGVAQAPRDITDTVSMSSGAAALAAADLLSAKGKLAKEKVFPPEKDVSGEEPRIGVVICHCGTNIASTVSINEVKEYIRTLPNVIYCENIIYACSEDSSKKIQDAIEQNNLNRFVVASCTPRTHEPLFRETCQAAGLNPYLFEFANIREHCSWVHRNEPKEATEKAKEIIRAAVARARLLKPQKPGKIGVTQRALVIGGGVTGMEAAYNIARLGFEVILVERDNELGGLLRRMHHMFIDIDPKAVLAEKISKIESEKKISVHLGTMVEDLSGFVGNFDVKLTDGTETTVGAIVIAAGCDEWKPNIYGYGQNDVYTQLELQEVINKGNIKNDETIVMIQCVGSREKGEREYCSRICCSEAIKNALEIKEKYPTTNVYILYRDIRTFAKNAEEKYREAALKGVRFIRYDINIKRPEVDKNNVVHVFDTLIQKDTEIKADKVVLSAAVVPRDGFEDLSKLFRVPLGQDGFFLEAHLKLRPLDFTSDGFFLCGTAQGPKDYIDNMAQAIGVASRVARILSKKEMDTEATTSRVNENICIGCGRCVDICPYNAIKLVPRGFGVFKSRINDALCKGCGACAAECPTGAIEARHFDDKEISVMIDALLKEEV